MKIRNTTSENPSILDRLFIGIFSGIATLILVSIIWFSFTTPSGYTYVIGFSVFVGILGALLKVNFVATIIDVGFKIILAIGGYKAK